MTSTPIIPPFVQNLTLGPSQQAASDAKEQFRVEVAAINANAHLTLVGKQTALDKLRERTRAAIKDAETGHHAAIEKRITQLKRTLRDRSPNESNDAALAISYRDAAQRAAEVAAGADCPKKSLELMRWALQNGDIPLQKAVLGGSRTTGDSRTWSTPSSRRARRKRKLQTSCGTSPTSRKATSRISCSASVTTSSPTRRSGSPGDAARGHGCDNRPTRAAPPQGGGPLAA